MFLRAVLLPFLWSRLLLAGVAWLGSQMGVSWTYPVPEAARRGFAFVPQGWLDAFGRWDAHWYLDVAMNGYAVRGPLATVQSNVAFFPLYPWTVRAVHLLVPGKGEGSWYVAALLVSNAALLGGLWILWRMARDLADEATASRAVLYALLFPTGFVLSGPYPEALFLLLSVASLAAAMAGRGVLAGVLGLLLALARPGGVLVAVPLVAIALEGARPGASTGWRSRSRERGAALAAACLPGLGLAGHAALLWRTTGDPLALFHAQAAWNRALAAPWTTLLAPRDFHPWMGPFEAGAVALVIVLGAWLLARRETRALGVWALVSMVPVLLSGTFLSASRFAAVSFPAFLALGMLARRPGVDRAVVAGLAVAQAALFLLWSRFFWVA